MTSDNERSVDPLLVMRTYISMAIRIGALAYTKGDLRGCYEVYACTARLLLKAVNGAEDSKDLLREALGQCSLLVDMDEMAWRMRRAFDAILGEQGASLAME